MALTQSFIVSHIIVNVALIFTDARQSSIIKKTNKNNNNPEREREREREGGKKGKKRGGKKRHHINE